MANPDHLLAIREGVQAWNAWRNNHCEIQPDLAGADLSGMDLHGADLRGANLRGAEMHGTKLENANLTGANLNCAWLSSAKLVEAHLYRASLAKADLFAADLTRADLREANLWKASLGCAALVSADLSNGVNLVKANLNHAYLRGAKFWQAELKNADLTEADLARADFTDANMAFAKLCGARLKEAKMRMVDLYSADLSAADLSQADFLSSSLVQANLSRTTLHFTNLSRANLRNANFEAAETLYTDFAYVGNLGSVHGLDAVKHGGPSTIDLENLFYLSDKLPVRFLVGLGVPNAFLTYAKSLVESAIEYYSLFISYSTNDQDFADRLYADLQAKGIRCWFAPHDIQGGRKIHEQIDEAIRLHDKLLLILSPDSMKSSWVETEISKARNRELRDKARVLFPVRLVPFKKLRDWECFDADTGKDSAREIREYFIPDFSNWKDHDSYRVAFDRLVRDLQAPVRKTSMT